MAKKITRKNFYMEIRRSFGRFISILFIVALGVAFFSGIRASLISKSSSIFTFIDLQR